MYWQQKGDFFIFVATIPKSLGNYSGIETRNRPAEPLLDATRIVSDNQIVGRCKKPYTKSTAEDRLTCKDRENPDELSSPFDCRFGVCDFCSDGWNSVNRCG